MLGVDDGAIVFSGKRKAKGGSSVRQTSSWASEVYGGQSTHIPLKINTAGVLFRLFLLRPLLHFLQPLPALFKFPGFNRLGRSWLPGSVLYTLMYVSMIIFFCFFYTAVVLNPVDMADNMKKYGGFIPGIQARPENCGLYL